jgi:hypothetical protein
MARLSKDIPENAVLAIFYDSAGDIIQIDPMDGGYLIDAHNNPVEIDPRVKLKNREDLCETCAQTILRENTTPSTTVREVHLVKHGCVWVEHGGRNVWRCP